MNTSTPLVSIIIPTYNRAHLIGETLDSVLAQTYTNWECIIVDDGSSDNTDEVVGAYVQKDARFKYFHRPDTHLPGGNGARNYGFLQSQGEYIQWFDSDDLMLEDKIKIKISEAILNAADIIISKHSDEYRKTDSYSIITLKSNTFYKEFILGKYLLITDDVIVKRSIIKTIQFDEYLHKAQEFDFFARLFNQELNYTFINNQTTIYRKNPDKSSKRIVKKAESLIYLSEKMIKLFDEDEEIKERFKKQGRKTYKILIKKKFIKTIFKHFNFFKKIHNKSTVEFFLYMGYNLLIGRGFYKIKPNDK